MSVLGIVLIALGIFLYVEFSVSWQGPWKVVASLYSLGIGIILTASEHPWMLDWLTK